jgi:hypothetical protein
MDVWLLLSAKGAAMKNFSLEEITRALAFSREKNVKEGLGLSDDAVLLYAAGLCACNNKGILREDDVGPAFDRAKRLLEAN